MMYTVGSVPYLNAKPLVRMFEDKGDASPVKVLYAVPSLLPAMLASGDVQAIMVSSIEALRHPGKRVAAGVCIGTQREVLSVRIFSKKPPERIESLALDQSSMTSNALARIILRGAYGVSPVAEPMAPDLAGMLARHDACVLIGDNGMRECGAGLHIVDLGDAWYRLTGLPFVWAVWLGDESLSEELSGYLKDAERYGAKHLDEIVRDSPTQTGLPAELCERYLREIMWYPMADKEIAGLSRFGELLVEEGLLGQQFDPIFVHPA